MDPNICLICERVDGKHDGHCFQGRWLDYNRLAELDDVPAPRDMEVLEFP